MMSWDDPIDPFDDNTRRQLRKWLGDFLPESVFHQIEEMMERMLEQMGQGGVFDNEALEEFMRNPQGTNPFVFGFRMGVGPDGKPIIQNFGNTRPDEDGIEITSEFEPLVDVIEEDDELVVVAELPGVEKDEIKVRVKGMVLTIDVNNPARPYHKTIKLPTRVKKDQARSAIRNGVLEIRLKKA
ncbi:MAG: archaeal heat shock protein Hsp20 [Candidatus Thorarchaeota archaeon]